MQERLDLPVFHDGQHGTAVVVLAALTDAAEVVGLELSGLRVVITPPAGAVAHGARFSGAMCHRARGVR